MRLAILVLVAACGSPRPPSAVAKKAPAQPEPYWKSTVTRSAPEPFQGVPGLVQILESTNRPDDFGSTLSSRLLVMRGGAIVCEVPYGGYSGHEGRSSSDYTELVVSSRAPLRFRTRTRSSGDSLVTPTDTCREYELPAQGSCKLLFEQPCAEACKAALTSTPSSGTGVIRGRVTREGEPVIGSTVAVGNKAEISDERGVFTIEVGPGTHELAIYDPQPFEPKPRILLGPGQDADVTIAIECSGR